MPRILCGVCRYTVPMTASVAGVTRTYQHCMQGVRGAPYRVARPVFVRETGADDEWPSVRLRGSLPTRYPMIVAT